MINKHALLHTPPNVVPLTQAQQHALVNCHSYEKYWWYRKLFERGLCPLCERPKEVYPELKSNDHWTIVEDTFAEKKGRVQTLIIVYKEHVGLYEWNSHYALADLKRINDWIYSHITVNIAGHISMEFTWVGDGNVSIDTAPEHTNRTVVIPDETQDVYIPVFKGPEHQHKNIKRATEFGIRYDAGEIPS